MQKPRAGSVAHRPASRGGPGAGQAAARPALRTGQTTEGSDLLIFVAAGGSSLSHSEYSSDLKHSQTSSAGRPSDKYHF